jgi:hypothetical protein
MSCIKAVAERTFLQPVNSGTDGSIAAVVVVAGAAGVATAKENQEMKALGLLSATVGVKTPVARSMVPS